MINTLQHIAQLRLHHQHVAKPVFTSVKDLVAHMGAMQAQDYEMAKWGIALRLKSANESVVEEALNKAHILRSHLLRPTWHIVSADDYRWILDLSAPQLKKMAAVYNKQVGLDERDLKKSYTLISTLLKNHRHLTRDEIMTSLEQSKIDTSHYRGTHIMFHAELNGLVCNGIRKGKQHTYALLDERVPFSKPISREEALAALASIYFTSHAPATVRDFSWWSGLTLAD